MLLVCVDSCEHISSNSKCTGGWTRLRFLPTTDRTNPAPALKNWCVTADHNSRHLNHSRWEWLLSELFPAGVQFLIGQLIDLSYFHKEPDPRWVYKKPKEHLQRSKNVISSLKVILQLGLKRVLLPHFNQVSSGAGSEPVSSLEAVLWVVLFQI